MYGFPINLIVTLFPSVKRRQRAARRCKSLPSLTFQQASTRVAHLVGEYRHDPPSGRFSDLYSAELVDYQPQVIKGSGVLVCRLARAILQGYQQQIALRYAVVIEHRSLDDLLSTAQRDLLWHVFQVPVYEQICTSQGHVLATECEAHQGMHIADDRVARAAGPRNIVSTPCGCGASGPRLLSQAHLRRPTDSVPKGRPAFAAKVA